MVRHLSPLDCLLKPASNVCIWLNGAVEAERPSWTRLWNFSQKRYCTDGGANRIVGREPELAPPDVVIGDMDSIHSVVAEGLKHRCLLVHAPDQDKTDLTKCLEYIAQDFHKGMQASRVVLLGGTSGRFDHTLAAINSLYYSTRIMDKDVYSLDGENLTCVLDEGEYVIKVDRHLVTGTCGVVPFCQKSTVVTMSGFRWNLEDTKMAFGDLISTSNFMEKDVLTVKTSAPLIFTMEVSTTSVL